MSSRIETMMRAIIEATIVATLANTGAITTSVTMIVEIGMATTMGIIERDSIFCQASRVMRKTMPA